MADESFKVKALEIAYSVAKAELQASSPSKEGVFIKGQSPEERREFADKLIKRTRELLDILTAVGKKA